MSGASQIFAQVGSAHPNVQLNARAQGRPVETQDLTHWNLNTPNQPYARWNINTSDAQNLLLNASALLGCHRQGVSMTDFPFSPLLSPNSSLLTPSLHYASIPARKSSARLPKMLSHPISLLLKKLLNPLTPN